MSYAKNRSERREQAKLPLFIASAFVLVALTSLALLLTHHGTGRGVVQFSVSDLSPTDTAPKGYVDLKVFYNAGLATNWMGGGKVKGRDLATLPTGVALLGGVPFKVQDVIQLRGVGGRKEASFYPENVKGIPVRAKCSTLYFLHATCWSVSDGTKIAAYRVHFADGTRLEIPVSYGTDVRDWGFDPRDTDQNDNPAWISNGGRFPARLYKTAWQNPTPQTEIKKIDFLSSGTACYPFLLAITADL